MAEHKGYLVPGGYFGWVEEIKDYRMFATEEEYEEMLKESKNTKEE